jgi:AraC family transcriptional regulator, L-rhamnose operon transcriptional activator RhaR
MRLSHYVGENYFSSDYEFYMNKIKENCTKDTCNFHTHDFAEICYVSMGKGLHLVNEKQYQVSKGDLFIIQHNMQHTFIKEENSSDDLIVYNLSFMPSFIDHVLNGIQDLDFTLLPASFLFLDIDSVSIDKVNIGLAIEDQKEFDDLLGKMYQEYTMKPN